jgi:selenocysteine lyase/cysteine desulfurase
MGPHGYPETYYGDARKFDSGGKANPLLLPLLRKAMEEIASINAVEAQSQLKVLMQPLLDWAAGNGYSIKTAPRAYHLIGLVPNEKTPEEMIEIANRLAAEKGVILAIRCGGFRVSPYLTNTPNDVRKLIEGLEDLC